MRTCLALLAIAVLSACGSGPRYEAMGGFQATVERDRKGEVIKRIPFHQGSDMTVRLGANHATVIHSKRFQPTDGQRRELVAQASNCRVTYFLGQKKKRARNGEMQTTYALAC